MKKRISTVLLVLVMFVTMLHGSVYASDSKKTEFGSDEVCTHGRFITYLWRQKGCPEPVLNINHFYDLAASDYYYKAALWAVEKAITGGVGAGQLGGDQPITRARFALELWRAFGTPEPKSSINPFVDVSDKDEYYNAVLWVVEQGITGGVGPGVFGPEHVCTRAQIITFIWAANGKPEPRCSENPFTDVTVTDYYYNAVLWAVGEGIVRPSDADLDFCEHVEGIKAAVAATCTESGLTEGVYCTLCKETIKPQKLVPALGHEYVGVVITKPTCIEYGLKRFVCKNDNAHTYDELLDPTKEHDVVIDTAVAPNCVETGLTEGKHCAVCGEVIVAQDVVSTSGHQFVSGKCSVCGIEDPDYVTPLPEQPAFKDVPTSMWYAEPIQWAVSKRITGGIGEGLFGPDNGCTRGQVVMFLWAANGKPEPKSLDNPFDDVSESDYYYKAVLWAVENGITGGIGEGLFGPHATCTRAQIVTFLYSAQGKPEVSGSSTFTDVLDTDWYVKPVLWAAEKQVTGGIGKGMFGPNNTCTRGQVVTFLYKVYG